MIYDIREFSVESKKSPESPRPAGRASRLLSPRRDDNGGRFDSSAKHKIVNEFIFKN